MTQDYLDNEIQLGRKLFMHYTDKMTDYLFIGDPMYQQWYRDSLQLYFLVNFLEDVILSSNTPYLGQYELTENTLRYVFDKIREYYLYDYDEAGSYGDPNIDIVIPTIKDLYLVDWKEIDVNITVDNTTAFNLPFNYTNIDPETLIVSVEGYSAIIDNTEVGEGYHITDNIFYWHHYFNLDSGYIVHFKYKQIAGL